MNSANGNDNIVDVFTTVRLPLSGYYPGAALSWLSMAHILVLSSLLPGAVQLIWMNALKSAVGSDHLRKCVADNSNHAPPPPKLKCFFVSVITNMCFNPKEKCSKFQATTLHLHATLLPSWSMASIVSVSKVTVGHSSLSFSIGPFLQQVKGTSQYV